jgi:cell division GTPase FtsZ
VHALCAVVTPTASDDQLKAFNRSAVLLLNELNPSRVDGSVWTPDALTSLNGFLDRTGVATNVNLYVSLDADELRQIFPLGSIATLGVGFGTGINRGLTAVNSAIENPMLGPARLQRADSVLININAPVGYRLSESNAVMKMVRSQCNEGVYLIYTCRTDQLADDNLEVSISASRALEGANA